MLQTFGMRLERLRAARGLRSKQLAALVGLDPSYITQLERGRRDPPRRVLIDKLAKALGLEAHEAAQLGRAAANERLLRAISSIDVRAPAMEVAEELIRYEDVFDETGYLALRAFLRAYVISRGEEKKIDHGRQFPEPSRPAEQETTM